MVFNLWEPGSIQTVQIIAEYTIVLNDVFELNSDRKTNGPNLTSTNVLSLKVMSGLKLS